VTRSVVEVFADIACPFTHVGLRRVVARRTELGLTEPRLRVRAWPLELVNGRPLDPAAVAQHVEELRELAAPELFRGFDPDVLPSSSLPALALAAAAYGISDESGERVSLALRDAVFERGLDVSDTATLDEIATAYGIPRPGPDDERDVIDDFEEGTRRGVRGSPEFYLEAHGWFCPALHIEKVDDRLEIELSRDGFETFLAQCFT
jgi:predicted DsbA family dithiol-disulfide isomerase